MGHQMELIFRQGIIYLLMVQLNLNVASIEDNRVIVSYYQILLIHSVSY